MKRKLLIITLVLPMLLLVLQSCTSTDSNTETTPVATEAVQTTPETTVSTDAMEGDETMTLTIEELSQYNGKDGNPAYIAVDGVIYDVTDVPYWSGGEHNGFSAGQELTEEIKTISPHGVSKLNGLPVVGTLAE